jgi:hypothetical protein
MCCQLVCLLQLRQPLSNSFIEDLARLYMAPRRRLPWSTTDSRPGMRCSPAAPRAKLCLRQKHGSSQASAAAWEASCAVADSPSARRSARQATATWAARGWSATARPLRERRESRRAWQRRMSANLIQGTAYAMEWALRLIPPRAIHTACGLLPSARVKACHQSTCPIQEPQGSR